MINCNVCATIKDGRKRMINNPGWGEREREREREIERL